MFFQTLYKNANLFFLKGVRLFLFLNVFRQLQLGAQNVLALFFLVISWYFIIFSIKILIGYFLILQPCLLKLSRQSFKFFKSSTIRCDWQTIHPKLKSLHFFPKCLITSFLNSFARFLYLFILKFYSVNPIVRPYVYKNYFIFS